MAYETTKALARRLRDPRFAERFFVGKGIDIGCGPDPLGRLAHHFPRMTRCTSWDLPDGDAQEMQGVPAARYQFVHSSHCLEHLRSAHRALRSWWRILAPGGHLVVMVPDEDLYEQGIFPSTFNADHKASFTLLKPVGSQMGRSWSPESLNVFALIGHLLDYHNDVEVLSLLLLDEGYQYDGKRRDQTLGSAEAGIEFILRKRPTSEVMHGGRYPHA